MLKSDFLRKLNKRFLEKKFKEYFDDFILWKNIFINTHLWSLQIVFLIQSFQVCWSWKNIFENIFFKYTSFYWSWKNVFNLFFKQFTSVGDKKYFQLFSSKKSAEKNNFPSPLLKSFLLNLSKILKKIIVSCLKIIVL